jgi:hypothetical protein
MQNRSNSRRLIVYIAALAGAVTGPLFAQSTFSGFLPGNLVLSRSVYTGDATTVTVGQKLPPNCPATATCSAVAVATGVYPGVWNNSGSVDGSFGVTSPIFLDQITTEGTRINSLAVPTSMLVTSFSSKSELGLQLSPDGTVVTFMGYVAPVNTLDVSNSNTPGVVDPTNPVGGSYYRAIAQIYESGGIQITNTNAYSGNNGRGAILANGYYFCVGNDNNGSATTPPANLVNSTGVEIVLPGATAGTPVEVGTFSISQVTDPASGLPYAPDKAGKDTNFRGLTIFDNTIYVTKGSGSNGVNTVYQVGHAGSLPTLATAASAPMTILPGLPTTLAKNADATNPFGIWFANSTTLYVADEGDGTTANAAKSQFAGLQKWSLVDGVWQLDYVLQNGLNLGQPYSVPTYPTSLNPATDGLRNITGRNNGDGTVTIWAITSTISASGDQGADPNKLVAVNDVLDNTDPLIAPLEPFTTLVTAGFGEVLRGVSFTPGTLVRRHRR